MAKPTVLPLWDETEVNSTDPGSTREQQGWLIPGGVPEKPAAEHFNFWQNLVWKWINEINIKGLLGYDALTDYIAGESFIVASDGFIYKCLINNGPGSSVVSPIGNPLTWENYVAANATGKVVDTDNTQDGAVATGTTQIPADDTAPPQNTEGDQYMALPAYTPDDAANLLKIEVVFNFSHSDATTVQTIALFQDSIASAIASVGVQPVGGGIWQATFIYWVVAGSTAARTYKIRSGSGGGGTTTFNGIAAARLYTGTMASTMTITEYLPS